MPLRLLMCFCAIALVASCFADAKVLTVGGPLSVKVEGEEPLLERDEGPLVRGTVTISPHPIRPVCDRIVFYLDEEPVLSTAEPGPRLVLDTRDLPDGLHAVRIEAERAGKLFASTGSVAFTVANEEGSAVASAFLQMPEQPAPPFEKLYRVRLSHEAIWFDGEEADLERHAFIRDRRIYITLTDLLRHIGGQLVWGPTTRTIEVHRNDITIQFTPGSRYVRVNNNRVDIQHPVVVRQGRSYVPVRPICDLLGVHIEWNRHENRAYVYAPRPGYAVARREYPWVSPVTGEPLVPRPGRLTLRNLSDLPIHVRLQGNGFHADWHIGARATLDPVFVAPGTYQVTVWSRQGADYNDFITVAADIHDRYKIDVHNMTLVR